MKKIKIIPGIFSALLLGWMGLAFLTGPASGGTLPFSKPEQLVTIPWSNGSNHGVTAQGPEWIVVDSHGHFVLESNLDFDFYDPNGQYLKTLNPMDKSRNFYGFSAMEVLPDGSTLLLARLESPQEQWGKDNFQEHSKPGARLIVLSPEGRVKLDKEELDSSQPHSNYYMEKGVVYSVHDDGSYQILESLDSQSPQDPNFGNFASIAYNLDHWLEHLRKLPVFRSGNKVYHDTKGNTHQIKDAVSFLMGRPFVEGLGPLAVRDGKIYYQAVCDKNQEFINVVFVEDSKKKDYGLVELFRADEDLDAAHGHALFVDQKGNLYEGVAKKDGYRIYEWKYLH